MALVVQNHIIGDYRCCYPSGQTETIYSVGPRGVSLKHELLAMLFMYIRFQELSRPNPEETASILSLATFTYLDSLILLANRVPHLTTEQLPPIALYNRTQSVVKRSYPTLDPFSGGKNRHMFWGLLSVFRKFTLQNDVLGAAGRRANEDPQAQSMSR